MARKRTRRNTKSVQHIWRFGSPGVVAATAVLVVLSLWLLVGLVNQVITGVHQDQLIAARQKELSTVIADTHALATSVAESSSPAYAEQVAREQLGYAREGDTVILPSFPQVTPTANAPTTVPIPSPMPQANWRGWVNAFFPPGPSPTPVP